MELLRRHAWPGNVRELLHVVEAATVVCEGAEILADHLSPSLRDVPHLEMSDTDVLPTLREVERQHIKRVLGATGGHRGNAADILGISERNLYRKLKDHS